MCSKCAEPFPGGEHAAIEAGLEPALARTAKFMKGRGCERCNQTGYKGRVGLFEVMEINDAMRLLILENASATRLREQAISDGMLTLRQSGLQKVCEGMTTVEEIARETVH